MEVVGLVRTDGHKRCCHREAVEVTTDRAVHVSEFLGLEIVGRREIEVPVFGRAYRAVEGEVLGNLAVILHFLLVERAIAVTDGIIKC